MYIRAGIRKIIQNRVVHHILFWALSFYVLLQIFSDNSEIYKVDYIYTSVFMFTLQLAVYFNHFLIIPKYLNKKEYVAFGVLVLMLVVAVSLFNVLLYNHLIDYILPGYYFISYFTYVDVLKFFIAFLAVTTLLKLSKDWFQLADARQKLTEMQREKFEIELKALRAQVNPHFLFNSLNVLYSLALKNSKESPKAIIELSDILRYVIYDSNKDKVKISAEVKLIEDYLSLQSYRTELNTSVEFNHKIANGIEIAPMLFLPLLENSFKHGIKGDIEETFVRINLKADKQLIRFEIENNKGETRKDKNEPGGVGLENIQHRLQLIYPGCHRFKIDEQEDYFKVKLEIENED